MKATNFCIEGSHVYESGQKDGKVNKYCINCQNKLSLELFGTILERRTHRTQNQKEEISIETIETTLEMTMAQLFIKFTRS